MDGLAVHYVGEVNSLDFEAGVFGSIVWKDVRCIVTVMICALTVLWSFLCGSCGHDRCCLWYCMIESCKDGTLHYFHSYMAFCILGLGGY